MRFPRVSAALVAGLFGCSTAGVSSRHLECRRCSLADISRQRAGPSAQTAASTPDGRTVEGRLADKENLGRLLATGKPFWFIQKMSGPTWRMEVATVRRPDDQLEQLMYDGDIERKNRDCVAKVIHTPCDAVEPSSIGRSLQCRAPPDAPTLILCDEERPSDASIP